MCWTTIFKTLYQSGGIAGAAVTLLPQLYYFVKRRIEALMRRDQFNAPLTEEEQKFAEENHYLIAKYLKKRRLPVDEWYDIVVFRYCRSVKRWFALPELHKHSFEIIAFYAMRSAIGHEYEKRARRIKTISLDAEVPNTNHLFYKDLVTNEDQVIF